MTITPEQLDELDVYVAKCAKFSPPRDATVRCESLQQLVAIARAALAWSESRRTFLANQTLTNREVYDDQSAALADLIEDTP